MSKDAPNKDLQQVVRYPLMDWCIGLMRFIVLLIHY